MECQQTVPDFLQEFTPSEGKLIFDDETDDEDNNSTSAAEGADTPSSPLVQGTMWAQMQSDDTSQDDD